MRISDWSSDVCSSDLSSRRPAASPCTPCRLSRGPTASPRSEHMTTRAKLGLDDIADLRAYERERDEFRRHVIELKKRRRVHVGTILTLVFECRDRSEEPTSELQSLMRISYAVFCLKQK